MNYVLINGIRREESRHWSKGRAEKTGIAPHYSGLDMHTTGGSFCKRHVRVGRIDEY